MPEYRIVELVYPNGRIEYRIEKQETKKKTI